MKKQDTVTELNKVIETELNKVIEIDGCTRLEIVDVERGRIYVNRGVDNVIKYSLQDDGKTLKIFVDKKVSLKDKLKIEVDKLTEMTRPANNNVCSIDAIREQQSIVHELLDEIE